MIKIINPELDTIAEEYFNLIKNDIIKIASIHKTILELANSLSLEKSKQICQQYGWTDLKTHTELFCNKLPNANTIKRPCTKEAVLLKTMQSCKQELDSQLGNNTLGVLEKLVSIVFTDEQVLKDIILVRPDEIDNLKNKIPVLADYMNLGESQKKLLHPFIESVFDYKYLSIKEDNQICLSYWLTQKLGVLTCPYCNRSPIHTVISGTNGLIRPTLDHFFPQSRYPYLALSFYNLIPSCSYCNSSLKHSKDMDAEWHLNPYVDGFGDDVSFSVLPKALFHPKSNPSNYRITFQKASSFTSTEKAKQIFGDPDKDKKANDVKNIPTLITGNIRLFKLEEIYQVHTDVVGELLVKCDKYHAIKENLKGFSDILGNTNKEFYNFYFANHLDIEDHHKRPLAKLTRDIILSELSEEFE